MVVSMQNRYVDLLMNELGNDRYNLERENLLDVIQPKLSAANYKGACVSFADNLAFKIVPCIIIALIIIGILTIIMFIIASSYKFHAKTSAKNYAYGNNVVYRVQTDNFIRTYTTKHKIESNSGGHSGGGHSGGGGRSHGGRHF